MSAGIKSCVFEVFPYSGLILGRQMFVKKTKIKTHAKTKSIYCCALLTVPVLPQNTDEWFNYFKYRITGHK